MTDYVNRVHALLKGIPEERVIKRPATPPKVRVPTQAFTQFVVNREMGDWAEDLVRRGIDEMNSGLSAVRYGRSERIVAGEVGFKEYFESYHKELFSLGKRPDLLLYHGTPPQIDEKKDGHELIPLAKKSIAGFEVRSSQHAITKERTPDKLCFTPKIEDIWNVVQWIEHHHVKHFYVQVVFGAVYAIPFTVILEVLSKKPQDAGYTIEKEARNQFKSTIYLPLTFGRKISVDFVDPKISAFRKDLQGGRVLFGVAFSEGRVRLDSKVIDELLAT